MQIFKLKKNTRKKTRKKSQKKYITAQVTSLNQLIALTKQKLNSCLHKKKLGKLVSQEINFTQNVLCKNSDRNRNWIWNLGENKLAVARKNNYKNDHTAAILLGTNKFYCMGPYSSSRQINKIWEERNNQVSWTHPKRNCCSPFLSLTGSHGSGAAPPSKPSHQPRWPWFHRGGGPWGSGCGSARCAGRCRWYLFRAEPASPGAGARRCPRWKKAHNLVSVVGCFSRNFETLM